MHSRYYYAYDPHLTDLGIDACNRASDEHPLTVNCAGNVVTSLPFTTDNPEGRKDFYFLYMASGRMCLTLPGGEHTISSGDAVLFPPELPYRYVFVGDGTLSYFWVHFTGSHTKSMFEELGLTSLPHIYHIANGTPILDGFHHLFDHFEAKSPWQRAALAHALEGLLLSLAHAAGDTAHRQLEASVRHIHAAYHTELRIPDLAKMENLSNSRYIALFSKQMGTSPSAYIIRLRMNTACELLRGTDMSVRQIGSLVGYADPHFFSRIFKKHLGVSPAAYRSNTQAPDAP